jgi:Aspartic acid proteinase inhibitor
MKIKLSVTIALAALFIILGSVSASFAQSDQIVGGYGDANVKDKNVIAAAKFAVKKGAVKEKATITLVSIKQAQQQVVAGLNYEVCLEINVKKSGKKAVKKYAKAVVYRNLKNVYSLTSWKMTSTPPVCK